MAAVNLATLPAIPYVYSGTTPGVVNTCQLITVPSVPGVSILIHNRDKASKTLRVSFDATLTQDGAAPSMWFTIEEPLEIKADSSAHSGFQPAHTLALFSAHASTNYEIIFVPT
jgi:hypothetical protein